jgi:ribonuclease-3
MNLQKLSQLIAYQFSKPELLQRALTHRSYSATNYERFEFLGDSVLNCAIAKFLFDHYPNLPEGDLSRLRSNLVNQQTLATLAQQLKLGELILFGEGELKSGGQHRPSILADAFEALLGGVFLDGGFVAAEKIVVQIYTPYLASIDWKTLGKDAKTLLQEILQARKLPLPQYAVLATQGEAHEQTFEVECRVEKLKISTRGRGASRRIAEQIAAEAAYQRILS